MKLRNDLHASFSLLSQVQTDLFASLSLFRHLLLDFSFCPHRILSLLCEFLASAGCSRQSPGARPCPASIRSGWAGGTAALAGL